MAVFNYGQKNKKIKKKCTIPMVAPFAWGEQIQTLRINTNSSSVVFGSSN